MGTEAATREQLLDAIEAIASPASSVANRHPRDGIPDEYFHQLEAAASAANALLTPRQDGEVFQVLKDLVDAAGPAIRARQQRVDDAAARVALGKALDQAHSLLNLIQMHGGR